MACSKNMNALVAVNIAPLSTAGASLAEYVVEVIKVIEASGLPHRTTSMFTEVEGAWDAVMQVVKDATFVLAQKGLRVSVTLKADVQIGAKNKLTGKVEKIEKLLGRGNIL
ncbi:MAG: MTH1187 family thiamine-binding protein [Defluviitaleaceae bacterium]|nr:MTH1187 family thiamine-binding protein [Defluviitaleaceae bacterium]